MFYDVITHPQNETYARRIVPQNVTVYACSLICPSRCVVTVLQCLPLLSFALAAVFQQTDVLSQAVLSEAGSEVQGGPSHVWTQSELLLPQQVSLRRQLNLR